MIPFSDNPPRRHGPPVVMPLIVAINILVFLYELTLGPSLDRLIFSYGTIPYEITHGVDIPPMIPFPVYVTLFTSMFIHQNILHIGGNMLFLWVFGDNVEDQLGRWLFLLFYLACGLAASFAQILVDVNAKIPAIGASGAIAGALAAYLVLFPRSQVRTLLLIGPFFTITRISAVFLIGFWILLQIVSGLFTVRFGDQSGGIAYFAHIGGFVAGLILILILRPREPTSV